MNPPRPPGPAELGSPPEERFEVLRELGSGAVSRVELVRDRRDGSLYARKSVSLVDEERLDLLCREFRLRGRIAHPQVPAAHRLGRDERAARAWLLVDHVEGVDLGRALRERGSEAFAPAFLQALNAVAWIHRRGVIHGDLKPENLCVQGARGERSFLVRLLDFGTAVDLARGERELRGGTPAYLAPWARERGADPRVDLFALGRTFQECLGPLRAGLSEAERDAVEACLARLVHPDPDLAYASAEAALEALRARLPALARVPLPRPLETTFVGREAERAWFRARREELLAGLLPGNVLVVRGAEGSGKTRLLSELEREALLAGLAVTRIHGESAASGTDPLVRLVARALSDEAPGNAELARALAAEREAPSQRLLRDLARALKEDGVRRPLVVFLDDLELSSEAALEFLRIYARLSSPTGPLVVAALGDERPLSGRFELSDAAHVLELAPMTPSGLEEVAASLFLETECAELPLGEWVALARGSVGVVAALARAAEAGAGGTDGRADELLRSLLERRLAGLGQRERGVLASLAILARPVPPALLARVAGLSTSELAQSLDLLLPSGLLEVEVHEGGRRYGLASRLLEEPLAGALSAEERRELHARALEAWSAWSIAPERPTEALVRHALGAGLPERAVELGGQAARGLLARGALRAAEELVELVLPHAVDARVEAELGVLAAESKLRAGKPREARAALTRSGVAPDSEWRSRDMSDARSRAGPDAREPDALLPTRLWILGASAEAEGDLDAARTSLARAREESQDSSLEVRQRIHERLGAVHYRSGDLAAAQAVWEAGLALGSPDERTVLRGELLNDLGVLAWRAGDLALARERHELALGIRREIGDLDGESRSLTNLANVAVQRGDFAVAAGYYEESLRLKRLVGSRASQALTLRNLATLYRNRGDYGKGVACLRESIELREATGDRLAAAATRRQLAVLLLEKGEGTAAAGELALARAELDPPRAPALERAGLREAEGRLALEHGRFAEALAAAELGLADLPADVPSGLRPALLRLRARVRAACGEHAAAAEDARLARDAAEGTGDPWEIGWSRALLGSTLLACGERERAAEEIAGALELARRCEMTPLLADALLRESDVAARDGARGGSIGALAESERLCARLGLPALELGAWRRMGEHALECGFRARAVQWWLKGVARLQELVDAHPPEHGAGILGTAEHRELVTAMNAILGSRGAEPVELADLVAQARAFDELGARPGETRGLRPEILTRLLEISRAVNGLYRREEILGYLRDRLVELFGAENSQIVLVGRDGSYRLLADGGADAPRSFSVTLLDRVVHERRPILIQDTSHDPELHDKKSVHMLGLVSVLCAPLVVDGEVIGIIQFDHRSRPGPFTEEDLAVLELFAHQAATSLKNLLLVERLAESAEKVRDSQIRLQAGERLRALGEMSAGVAHDFNNLLTVITGITDLMLGKSDLPPPVRADLELLAAVSQTASGTIRRLQTFRGHAPALETRARIDPASVARQAAEMGRRRLAGVEQRHPIALELAATPPVLGQESELRDVLLNLIINAEEAMPGGGPIAVRAREERGAAVLEVEDRGPGVPPELSSAIFEPHFSTKPAGNGLGLWLARGTVHRMGGTLTHEPVEGGGARFRIVLPGAGPEEAARPVLARGATPSVLVIDDDSGVREIVCRMVEACGMRTVGSASGREALALFAHQTFDLVLTDYAMPGMNGAEVAREIKRLRADCPVVLLTGRSAQGYVPPRAGEPFRLILEKPITRDKLARALELCPAG
jgi:signal transduction histidine kinase/tetratricopeptide (TPR) repeat protein